MNSQTSYCTFKLMKTLYEKSIVSFPLYKIPLDISDYKNVKIFNDFECRDIILGHIVENLFDFSCQKIPDGNVVFYRSVHGKVSLLVLMTKISSSMNRTFLNLEIFVADNLISAKIVLNEAIVL